MGPATFNPTVYPRTLLALLDYDLLVITVWTRENANKNHLEFKDSFPFLFHFIEFGNDIRGRMLLWRDMVDMKQPQFI